MVRYISSIAIWTVLLSGVALGTERSYVVHMTDEQETTPCDPGSDGFADGTITLNDVTGLVSWNFTYANIAPPTLMHIHTGAAGVAGPILINLGVVTTGGPNTLINSTTHGNLAQVTGVLNNPQGFYVNIHTAAPCTAGVVRGQVGCDDNADCASVESPDPAPLCVRRITRAIAPRCPWPVFQSWR